MRQRGRERHAADLHMAGDEIEDRRAAAAIDDVDELRLFFRRHVFGDHVADQPMLGDTYSTPFGVARISAISSLKLFAGEDECTTNMLGGPPR